MQAVILAAGMGKRLKELTATTPKCMVKVNGISLIERTLKSLEKLSLSKIVIVDGYESEKLRAFIKTLGIETQIDFVHNPIFDKTNNIYSLYLAKDFLAADDTLLLESDIIFEEHILSDLANLPAENVALVSKYKDGLDGTCVKLQADGAISAFISGKNLVDEEKSEYFKTVNFYKLGKDFLKNLYLPSLEIYRAKHGDNEYYEAVFGALVKENPRCMYSHCLRGEKWYEIDNKADLSAAKDLFFVNVTK